MLDGAKSYHLQFGMPPVLAGFKDDVSAQEHQVKSLKRMPSAHHWAGSEIGSKRAVLPTVDLSVLSFSSPAEKPSFQPSTGLSCDPSIAAEGTAALSTMTCSQQHGLLGTTA